MANPPRAMHDLLLYGQVPAPRHEQVKKILAGVAAMQPRRVLERHVVYRPQRDPDEPGAHLSGGGGTQTIANKNPRQKPQAAKDLFYTRTVQKLADDDFGRPVSSDRQPAVDALSHEGTMGFEPKWSIEFQDLPDTGDRGVSIRLTTSTDLLTGDPHTYMVANGPHRYGTSDIARQCSCS